MNAVILYEDSDLARSARDVLAKAAYRADGELQWAIKPWRLDMLLQPPSAEAALEDAAGAHLIVLAVRNLVQSPSGVLDWLEQWARGRQVEDAALAVYDGDESNALTATPSPELEQFAGRHGLSFILGDLHTDDEEGTVFTQRFLRERAVAMTRTLQRILDRTAYDRYRAWGINE